MQVSFGATFLAVSLGLGGKLLSLWKSSTNSNYLPFILIHFYGFIYLATITVVYSTLLFVFGIYLPNWVTLLILFLPLLIAISKLGISHKSISLPTVLLSFLSLWFCMFLAGLPYCGNLTADIGYYFPANDNHDIFAYLIRASFLSSNISHLPSTLNGIPMEEFMLNISSKFSASYILSFLSVLSKDYGLVSGMGIVFVKGLLIHLLSFGLNRSQIKDLKSWLIAIIIALLPLVTWLQSWYYLSQLFFIYASILIILVDWQLSKNLGKDNILSMIVIFILAIYFTLMYPAAIFPLLLIISIESIISNRKLNIFAKQRKMILLLSLSCLFIIGISFFKYTELNTHITFDYFSVSYLSLLGQIWQDNSNLQVLWQSKDIGLKNQFIGLFRDVIYLSIAFFTVKKFVFHKYFLQINLIIKALITSWLFYQLIFFLSDANYRAFKFGSTFITIFSLLLLSTFLITAKDNIRRLIIPILLLFLAINFIPFFNIKWNNSFSKEEVRVVNEMMKSTNKIIISDIPKYYVNMMLTLKIEKRDLYILGNSYYIYQLNSNDQLCYHADQEQIIVYYEDDSPTANIIEADQVISDRFYSAELDRQSCYDWASQYPQITNKTAPIYQNEQNIETLFQKIF